MIVWDPRLRFHFAGGLAARNGKYAGMSAVATARSTAAGAARVAVDIVVVSDVICPFCYVGKRNLERAIEAAGQDSEVDFDIRVEWRPFMLDPSLPANPGRDKMENYAKKVGLSQSHVVTVAAPGVSKKGGGGPSDRKQRRLILARCLPLYPPRPFQFGNRASAVVPHIVRAGKAAGLEINFGGRVGNTMDAHRLLAEALDVHGAGVQNDLAEALFRAYLTDNLDISDPSVLADLAQEIGMGSCDDFLASDARVAEVEADLAANASDGISGVPLFIFNHRYSLVGAQQPSVILSVLQKIARKADSKL